MLPVQLHRRVCAGIGALLAAVGMLVLLATPARAADAPVPTAVTVWVEPPTVLEPYTPATFRAAVSPANAAGTVTFTWDGVAFGNARVQGGQAVFESAAHQVGVHQLRAAFEPDPGSSFAGSTSAPVEVAVNAIARLFLGRADGSLVPPGSQVKPGETLTINATGYPAGSTVRFTLAGQAIPQTVTINAAGNGATDLPISTKLPSAVYQLVGQAQLKNAAFVFYIYNPPPQPTPAATATAPVAVPSPVASGGTSSGTTPDATPAPATTGTGTTIGSTSGGPGLADTGSDAMQLLAWGWLALGAGASLVAVAGRASAPAARHARC